MADHEDTKGLLTYKPNRYPTLPGGEANYISNELTRISNAVDKMVATLKLIEKRLNDNGLT